MAITRLILENFQSHAHTELDLSPGLTVIVGESDRGKSAVIRALRWLFFNEPRGTEFIRAGENECRVTAVFDDGSRLIRERSVTKNRNRYIISQPGEEERIFEGFGHEIPAEVIARHGVRPVELDDDLKLVLNLAGQLDPPFLLADPGGVKARAIGRLYGVHLVDAALRDTVQDITRQQREERQLAEEIAALDKQLKEYDDLPALGERLQRANQLMDRADAATEKKSALCILAQKLSRVVEDSEKTKLVQKRLAGIPDGIKCWSVLVSRSLRQERLVAVASRRDETSRQKAASLARWRATARVEQGKKKLAVMIQVVERWNKLQRYKKQLAAVEEEKVRQEYIYQSAARVREGRRQLDELVRLEGLWHSLSVQLSRRSRLRDEKSAYINIADRTRQAKEGLEKLDTLTRLIEQSRQIKDLSARLKSVQLEEAQHQTVVEKASGVEPARARVFVAHQLIKKQLALKVFAHRIVPLRTEKNRQTAVYKATGALGQAGAALGQLEECRRRVAILNALANRLTPLRQEQELLAGRLTRTGTVLQGRRMLAQLAALPARLTLLHGLALRLKDARERQKRGRVFLAGVEDDLRAKTSLYVRCLKELGRCPTCLAPVDAHTIERIASGFQKS